MDQTSVNLLKSDDSVNGSCTKGIDSLVPIDTQLTPYQLLTNTCSTGMIPSVHQLNCIDQKLVDCLLTEMSIECQPKCQLSIDPGSIEDINGGCQLTLNCRCL